MKTAIFIVLSSVWTISYAQNEITLKVMSYNIQQPYGTNWEARKDSVISLISQEQPDIIGTQEAVSFQRDTIIRKCSTYSWFGAGRDGNDNGEGCWIFFKTNNFIVDTANSGSSWLSDTPIQPSRFGGNYNRVFTWLRLKDKNSGRSFYIYNIHNYLPEEPELREKAAQSLMNSISKRKFNDPFILTGDFNSPENDSVTSWLKNGASNPIPLKDSYREIKPDGEAKTWENLKLDYIYTPISNQYITTSSLIVAKPNNASDHKPIVAVITIK